MSSGSDLRNRLRTPAESTTSFYLNIDKRGFCGENIKRFHVEGMFEYGFPGYFRYCPAHSAERLFCLFRVCHHIHQEEQGGPTGGGRERAGETGGRTAERSPAPSRHRPDRHDADGLRCLGGRRNDRRRAPEAVPPQLPNIRSFAMPPSLLPYPWWWR